jgi:hypothetical protein
LEDLLERVQKGNAATVRVRGTMNSVFRSLIDVGSTRSTPPKGL